MSSGAHKDNAEIRQTRKNGAGDGYRTHTGSAFKAIKQGVWNPAAGNFEKDVTATAITTGFQLGILVVGVTPDSSPMLTAPAATEPSPVSRSNQGRDSSID